MCGSCCTRAWRSPSRLGCAEFTTRSWRPSTGSWPTTTFRGPLRQGPVQGGHRSPAARRRRSRGLGGRRDGGLAIDRHRRRPGTGTRFGDRRVRALLAATDSLLRPRGGWAHQCGALPAHDRPPGSALHPPHRQATYDLRRLRRKGFLTRVPGRHLYRVTPRGRALACLLTKVSARVVVPALSELDAITARPRGRSVLSSRRGATTDALLHAADIAA